jgi:hypothetical protein
MNEEALSGAAAGQGTRRRLRLINVITVGVHARRSRVLFEKALGPDVEVGVISVVDRE